ncbi:MAG: His/Gly/Thr/Pro-type tRNA ligase C-terminal domain-containing protein, partial [Gaiellaceae bacterium]
LEEDAERERVPLLLAELRRAGVSCDTDYAGRSLKGQLTQAGRVNARTTVVVGAAEATIRRQGESDTAVALDGLAATLQRL